MYCRALILVIVRFSSEYSKQDLIASSEREGIPRVSSVGQRGMHKLYRSLTPYLPSSFLFVHARTCGS